MRKLALAAISFCLSHLSFAQGNLSVNDVSVLLPLTADMPGLNSNSALHGTFLTSQFYQQFIQPADALMRQFNYNSFRVVGIRLDPCFKSTVEEAACSTQIRLVAQPVVNIGPQLITLDSALHLFYAVPETEIAEIVAELKALKAEKDFGDRNSPLGVHPILSSESGVSGQYGSRLLKTYLSRIGSQRLFQVTFMSANQTSTVWNFGGFEIVGGNRVFPMNIPLLNNQRLQNFTLADGNSIGQIRPFPQKAQNLIKFLDPRQIPSTNMQTREQVRNDIAAIENPTKHAPGSVDCVSCHVAHIAKARLQQSTPGLSPSPETFQSVENISLTSSLFGAPKSIRAFGYFGAAPAFNQRVVNESAHVLDSVKNK